MGETLERRPPASADQDTKATDYAGAEPAYADGSLVETLSGKRLRIVSYKRELGLYVVHDEDDLTVVDYTVSPDRFVSIDDDEQDE